MTSRLLFITALFVLNISKAQTFTNSTGGAIPDNNTQTCFPVTVSGVGNINGSFGLEKVCINVTHAYDGDLVIELKSPTGIIIPLSVSNGFAGANYTNTCFSAAASIPITAGSPPFSGAFAPQGNLGDMNNGQNANGVWSLCLTDVSPPDAGILLNFSLTFSNTPAPPTTLAGDDPCTATLLTANAACVYSSFTNVGSTPSLSVPPPTCANYLGGDVWFKVVVPASTINIDTKQNTLLNGGMAIYKGTLCSSLTVIACDDNSSANTNMPYISAGGLTPGDTIWLRIWGRGATQGSFGICVSIPPPPNEQDCPAAISICQNAYSQPVSYTGTGTLGNEINPSTSCLSSGEKADVWYTFTVQVTGNLHFTITPNDLTEDYDWAVYNITNATCADIYSNASSNVSCNFSATPGVTGPTGGSSLNTQSAGGTPFNAEIPVTAGQTYVINVSNYSASQNGYSIDLSPSSATLFDNVSPFLKSANPVNSCGTNKVTVIFSENVLCSSIQSSGFVITGPGGPYTITGWNSASCASGATYGNNITLTVSPALIQAGAYQVCLSPSSTIGDLCGNSASGSCVNFNIDSRPTLGVDKALSICAGNSANLTTLFTTTGLTANWTQGGVAVGNPATVTTAGIYQLIVINASGCSDTATATLNVNSNIFDTTNLSLCSSQLPYTWLGNNYSAAGNYQDTITTAGTCDSILTLNLTLKASTTSTTNTSVCSSQLPYLWNGNSYNAAGTYTKTLVNAAGCDSIVKLVLTIKPTSTSTSNANVCSSQLPYLWNGNSYNAAGTYTKTLVNAAGCDSIVKLILTIKQTSTSTSNANVCSSQLPYLWNGNSYNAAGTYTKTLVNAAGCDSIAKLILTIKQTSTSTSNANVCSSQLPYLWNGNSYNAAGTYTKTLVNAAGCDSIVKLVLTIKPTSTSTTNANVCSSQLPYLWNGNSYNAAGTYTKTLVNAAGCDSIVKLVLTIKPTSTSTTNTSVCSSQLPYLWNGNSYNAAGTYTKTLVNAAGCDSIAKLILTIKQTSTSTSNANVCSSQLPYLWNGNSYNAAGTYTKTLVNAAGCDSIAKLVLTIKPTSTSTTNTSVCSSQLPYLWNGNSYNAAGTYTKTLVNAVGCDSIAKLILTIKPTSTSTSNANVCSSQLPYLWNGNSYNAAGTYTKTLVNAVGCDSIAKLILTIKPTSTSTTNISVCSSQLPYLWNGNSYNAAGNYTKTLVNAAGCDSIAKLVLTIKPTSTSTTNTSVCSSQLPYLWNGNSYNAAGNYTKTLVNAAGCDSIAKLILTIKQTSTSTSNANVCSSQLPYLWNGNSYNAAGTYTKTLVNAAGCDSIVKLVLTIKPTSTSTTNANVCSSQLPYLWNGNSYNAAGTYTKTLVNAAGCDSIVKLVLTIKPTSTSTTNANVCSSQLPYLWNGNSYNAAGTYTKTLVNAVGCDSIAKLILNIKPTSTSTTNTSVCSSQLPYLWNGNSYNAAGTYTKTLVNAVGCDSIAKLILTIKQTSTSTSNANVCSSQLPYLWNGNSYNAAATYAKTLVNAVGCDSIATLNLSVKNIPATPLISSNSPVCSGNVLKLAVANVAAGAAYDWSGPNGFSSLITSVNIINAGLSNAGTYSVSANVDGCISATASSRFTVIMTPLANAGPDKQVIEGDSIRLTPVVTASNLKFSWTPGTYILSSDSVFSPWVWGIADMTYYLTVRNAYCVSKPDAVVVKVLPRLTPPLIPNSFSPNGDGVNDTWLIRELAAYPEAIIEVYNRYGSKVFSGSGYKNAWDGTDSGKPLSAGTYYYILHITHQSKPVTGWVQIVR